MIKKIIEYVKNDINKYLNKTRYYLLNKNRLPLRLKGTDKLNIGCGGNFVQGWLNIGLFSEREIPYGTTALRDGALFLNFDMTKELPLAENSIQFIYSSHFIEHINFNNGRVLLKRLYRVMKKGGIIRLTFPDLELWIKKYYKNDLSFFKKYKSIYLKKKSYLTTKGQIFMAQVHVKGHKWGYDFESIKNILERAGFSQVKKKKAFNSLIPQIKLLESNSEGRLLETAYVEGVKKL